MRTFAFIDASNLFYGGEKSLGWKIDYEKLFQYLQSKYCIRHAFYFGGVEIHSYKYDYQAQETVPINELEQHIRRELLDNNDNLNDAQIVLLGRNLQRIRFYKHLDKYGYRMILKPVKMYYQENGSTKRKANCDVDMAFYLMKEINNFDCAIILSGDGDFLPVLKYLKSLSKEIIILGRGKRTAREIKQFAGSNFRDFVRLESYIKFTE